MRLIDEMRIDFDEVDISGCTDVDDIISSVEDLIDAQPTIEAVPVVHGRWVDNGIPESILSACSVCGFPTGAFTFKFCPNCGAKMDKEE